MSICFFHLKAYALFNPTSEAPIGGTLVQMLVVAKKLAERGNKVSFITGDYGQKDVEVHGGLSVYKSAKLIRTWWHMVIAPFIIWRTLLRVNADVYVSSSAAAEIGIIALFCMVYKKKFIYRCAHDIDCNGEYVATHGVRGQLFAFGLRHTTHIIAQSLEQQSLLRKTFQLDSVVIPNSYNLSSHYTQSKDTFILWVARCESWKHPELSLDAAERLPQYKFVMICPQQKYQEGLWHAIRSRAKTLPNVTFIDFVPFDTIQDYFNKAMIFLGTSDYEGFPNTYLQACMGATPIVSYKVNPDEFITTHKLGYVADGNMTTLEAYIKQLMEDHALWQQQSQHVLEYVRKNHDATSVIQLWLPLLAKS